MNGVKSKQQCKLNRSCWGCLVAIQTANASEKACSGRESHVFGTNNIRKSRQILAGLQVCCYWERKQARSGKEVCGDVGKITWDVARLG